MVISYFVYRNDLLDILFEMNDFDYSSWSKTDQFKDYTRNTEESHYKGVEGKSDERAWQFQFHSSLHINNHLQEVAAARLKINQPYFSWPKSINVLEKNRKVYEIQSLAPLYFRILESLLWFRSY